MIFFQAPKRLAETNPMIRTCMFTGHAMPDSTCFFKSFPFFLIEEAFMATQQITSPPSAPLASSHSIL